MEEKVLIEAKNLKKYFKVGANSQLHAVDGVNFKIKRGTTLGVVERSRDASPAEIISARISRRADFTAPQEKPRRARLSQVHAGPPAAAAL